MPQGPIPVNVAQNSSGYAAPMKLDGNNLLETTKGGTASALNQTAAAVIKGAPGRVAKVTVIAGGTASNGNFVLNDCLTTGAAAAANEILSIPSGAPAGSVYDLDWPCLVGIVLSAVPSAGSPILVISYT